MGLTPPLNMMMTDDLGKAAAFNTFFLQASDLDDSKAELPHNARLFHTGTGLENIKITLEDVADQMKCVDGSKLYGLDCIPPVLKRRYLSLCSS